MKAARQSIVCKPAALIKEHGWRSHFEEALARAGAHDVASIAGIRTLDDYPGYLDEMVR